MLPPGRVVEMLVSKTAMGRELSFMFHQREKLTSDYQLQEKIDVCPTLLAAKVKVDKGSNERFRYLGHHNAARAFKSLWHLTLLFIPLFFFSSRGCKPLLPNWLAA